MVENKNVEYILQSLFIALEDATKCIEIITTPSTTVHCHRAKTGAVRKLQ
jgi:hypothetical protein